jgi:ribosomal protein S18 acetylase RimI-like enzyme
MDLVLRPAATDDASFVAWGIDEATDGLFATMLGRPWQAVLTATIESSGHDFSLEHVTIVERDGEAIGMLSGLAVEAMRDPIGQLSRSAGLRIVRAAIVAAALFPTLRALGRHEPGEWYVQAVAVSASARGLGVGSRLLALAEERAQAAGASWITLDVAASNTGGRRLYERVGYEEQWTAPRASWLREMAVHRMRKPIGAAPGT